MTGIEELEEIETEPYPSYTPHLLPRNITGFVDGLQSIEQSLYNIWLTERYSHPIYGDDYGIELQQYIGQDFEYLAATIEETIRDAFTFDDRVDDIEILDVQLQGANSVLISVEVFTTEGDFEMGGLEVGI